MKLVRQRLKYDCTICSIAMATGRPWAEVRAAAEADGNFRIRRGTRREWQILERLGLAQGGFDGDPSGDFWSHKRGDVLDPAFFRRMMLGRRAIVAVPSLNTPGHWHSVYWDGERLWDPNQKCRYERFDQLLPDELILFREAALK